MKSGEEISYSANAGHATPSTHSAGTSSMTTANVESSSVEFTFHADQHGDAVSRFFYVFLVFFFF